jgi:hypothetical protein
LGRTRARWLLVAVAAAVLLAAGEDPATAATAIGFGPPVFVDEELAGGEPLVLTDNVHHTLIYTAHEGTTHLYRNGVTYPADFVANYRNQVNIWVSKDNGKTWQRDNFDGTGFATNPIQNQGFSDPDLTQDEGGRVYNTGIDLANDALFATNDGGYTWDRGTVQCHDGDRPWLAGGKKDEVFMGTNTLEGDISHEVFQSTDGGSTCSADGIPNGGTTADGWSYSGNGKLYYDHHNGKLIEPVTFTKGSDTALGTATWTRGQAAFDKPVIAAKTTTFAHWPAMAIDSADNVYLVWDTDPRAPNTTGGCSGAKTELPNAIQMSVSRDFGKTWSKPIDVAKPAGQKVYWPWVVAGDPGKVSVVWYQADTVVDLDCTAAKTSLYEATILDATSANPSPQVVNAVGRPIHTNFVCQGGTTCVATGQDRRLGDFFTNEIDPDGCVLIASGDTTRPAPGGGERPTALPIFLRQDAGPGLKGKDCGSSSSSCADVTPPVTTIKLGSTRQRIQLSGGSQDKGAPCASGVRQVQVSLARVNGQHVTNCRFLKSRTKYVLTEARSCRRPVLYKAKGTSKWSFTFDIKLPPGAYRAQARGTDKKGNKETPRVGRVSFRVR